VYQSGCLLQEITEQYLNVKYSHNQIITKIGL